MMSQTHPNNHQELFDGYLASQKDAIYEWSGSISVDLTELRLWAADYAAEYGLSFKGAL